MMDDIGLDLSRRRVHDQHLRPGAADDPDRRPNQCALAVSLHAPNDECAASSCDQPAHADRRAARRVLAYVEKPKRMPAT